MRIDSHNGTIEDSDYNYCYPYANGERVSAWEVVSVVDGEDWYDLKTITLTGYAPPARTPVTEIDSNTTLTQNIEGYVAVTGNVTLDLAGYTITGGGYHSADVINDGSTLTLTDSSSGKTGTITGGGGVMIYSGSFTMSGDSIIQNNSTESDGGGVYVYMGSFSLQNGTISNSSGFYGGGVGIGSGAAFNMTGGAIKENTANAGGGVYNSGGNFNMSNGLIDANRANWEGGVYQQSHGWSVFTMTGGSITNNIGGG